MCKIILSPCRLKVEARCLLFLRGKNEMVVPHQMDMFCYFPVFSKEKKIILLYDWRKATQRTFVHIKGGLRTLPGVPLPSTCLGFSIQLIRNKKKKKRKKEEEKKHLSIRQNSNNKSPGMFAASIRLSNAKALSTSSFNVIIQNGPISRYQAEFTFHIFTENWFLFTPSNHFI